MRGTFDSGVIGGTVCTGAVGFPSPSVRWCTSSTKRDPIERELRHYLKAHPRFGGRLVNAMGMRAEESAARARKLPWKRSDRNSRAGRSWFDWLPVFGLTEAQVFRVIRDAGQSPHWAYAAGMSRLSCSFCILASRADLRRAAELRPELYRRYAELEQRIGHTLSPSRIPLPELTGISSSESGDGEDALGLGSPRSRPTPARQPLARRSGLKSRCSRSGAARGSG